MKTEDVQASGERCSDAWGGAPSGGDKTTASANLRGKVTRVVLYGVIFLALWLMDPIVSVRYIVGLWLFMSVVQFL